MTIATKLATMYAACPDSYSFGDIDAVSAEVRSMPVADAIAVAREFGLRVQNRSQAASEVNRKLTEAKGSFNRIKPIAAK